MAILRTATVRVFISCLIVSLLFACNRSPESEAPDVIVLHTGRLRGNIYPLALQSIAPLQHYQYIAGYVALVRQEAQEKNARVILVDLGDSLTGSFASYATESENMVAFFNALNYDAIALSNLDNDVPEEVLKNLKARVLSPFLTATGQPALEGGKPAVQWDSGGLVIRLLANFYGDAEAAAMPERFPAWFGPTRERIVPVRDYPALVGTLPPLPEGSLTLLSWMKFEPEKSPPQVFLGSLSKAGVDGILAHRIYSSKQADIWNERALYNWSIPVSENILRNNGGFVVARLDLKRRGNKWQVLRHELEPMTSNTASADPEIIETIDRYTEVIRAADIDLFQLAQLTDRSRILEGVLTALGALDSVDGSVYSGESVRTELPRGTVRKSTLFNCLPWTTEIVRIRLDSAQVAQLQDDPAFAVALKNTAGNEGIELGTSLFFAKLIQQKFNLADTAITTAGVGREFDYFSRFFQQNPSIFAGSGPALSNPSAP